MKELVDGGQGFDVEFEGLIVLALDLEFGLEFFDEQLQARNLGFKFLDVGAAGLRAIRSGHVEIVRRCLWRLRNVKHLRCLGRWRNLRQRMGLRIE